MKILKISKDYIDAPLSHIFNLFISSGTFPEKLKTSIISPIFKKNETTDINNYRPISIDIRELRINSSTDFKNTRTNNI